MRLDVRPAEALGHSVRTAIRQVLDSAFPGQPRQVTDRVQGEILLVRTGFSNTTLLVWDANILVGVGSFFGFRDGETAVRYCVVRAVLSEYQGKGVGTNYLSVPALTRLTPPTGRILTTVQHTTSYVSWACAARQVGATIYPAVGAEGQIRLAPTSLGWRDDFNRLLRGIVGASEQLRPPGEDMVRRGVYPGSPFGRSPWASGDELAHSLGLRDKDGLLTILVSNVSRSRDGL